MFIDTYSLQTHTQQRAEELAQDYRNAKVEQAQVVRALGSGLERLALWLANWSRTLQAQPQSVALQPVRISSTIGRR